MLVHLFDNKLFLIYLISYKDVLKIYNFSVNISTFYTSLCCFFDTLLIKYIEMKNQGINIVDDART